MRARAVLAALLLPLPLVADPAAAGMDRFRSTEIAVGDRPTVVVAADFDRRDGPDLAVINDVSNDVSILLNVGDGTFAPPTTRGTPARPMQLVAADIDGQDGLDLVVAVAAPSNSVELWLNRGDGTFLPPTSLPAGSDTHSIAVADLDGANGLDLLVLSSASRELLVYLNQGAGSFATPVRYIIVSVPSWIAVGDLSADNIIDVVLGTTTGFLVYHGIGDGTLGSPRIELVSNSRQGRIAELDGYPGAEVIVTRPYGELVVFTNDGGGGMFRWGRISMGLDPYTLTMGDLNGDGYLDFVSGQIRGGGIVIGEGMAAMGIAAEWCLPGGGDDFSTPKAASTPVLADFDSDGLLDVAASNPTGDSLWVHLQGGPGRYQTTRAIRNSSTNPADLVVADLDGQNGAEVLVSMPSLQRVQIHWNDGRGPALVPSSVELGVFPYDLAVADLDGANGLDIAVASSSTNEVAVLLQGPGRSFAISWIDSEAPFEVLLADIDGAQGPDLVIANEISAQLHVWLNNGDGTFRADRDLDSRQFAGGGCCLLRAADFDGTNGLDILTLSRNWGQPTLLMNRGGGNFDRARAIGSPSTFYDAVVADLDGVNGPDIAYLEGDVIALYNDGSATFATPVALGIPFWPMGIHALDLDGSGPPELALTESDTGTVGLHWRDASGNYSRSERYAAGEDGSSIASGDLDLDGVPDFAFPCRGGFHLLQSRPAEIPRHWLLRNDELTALAPPTPALAGIFIGAGPTSLDLEGADLSPGVGEGALETLPGSSDDDDAYALGVNPGWVDPDPAVGDATRPLMFYQLDDATLTLHLVKDGGGSVRLGF